MRLCKGWKKDSLFGRLSDVAGGGPVGAYHYVSGADVGSVAAVAAYFYDLIQRQETTTLWEGGMARTVNSGTFCIWNAFRHVDLRIDFKVPGKTRVYVVDSTSPKTYSPDDRIWSECRVSSILRGMALFRKKTIVTQIPREIQSQSFRTFNPVSDSEKMQAFLKDVVPLFKDSAKLGSPSIHLSNQLAEMPTVGRLCVHIYLIMVGRGQHGDCVEFFSTLVLKFPLVVVYIAALCEEMGELKRGMHLLCAILSQISANDPVHSSILAAQMMLLMNDSKDDLAIGEGESAGSSEEKRLSRKRKRAEYAISIGKKLVTLQPYTYSAWILLAKAYILAGDFPNGLIALNTAPLRYSDRAAEILRNDPSQLALSSWTFDFAFSSQGGRGTKWRKRFSTDNFISLNFAAYDLLVIIESAIGWNGFLDLRNTVFITNVDVAKTEVKKVEGQASMNETVEVDLSTLSVSEETNAHDLKEEKDEEKKGLGSEETQENAKVVEGEEGSDSANPKVDSSTLAVSKETDASDELQKNAKVVGGEEGSKSTKSVDEEVEPEDGGQGLSLERKLYAGPEPTILYKGRPRPCQPTLDALIGILYKDVHDFAVWFHEDHDELMADMQEHGSDNDSESDHNEPNTGNESSVQASVSDKETKPTDESDQGAGDDNGSNEAEVKINENEEEATSATKPSSGGEETEDESGDESNDSDQDSSSGSSSSGSSSSSDSDGSSQEDENSSDENDDEDETSESILTRGVCIDRKPRGGTKAEKKAYKLLKLGYLFCRLQYYNLAFHVLDKCVGLAYSLDAWEAILLLSTHVPKLVKDSLSTAMLAIVQILLSIDEHEDSTDLNDTHPFIRESLITMIGKSGLSTVKATVSKVEEKFMRQAKKGVIDLSPEKLSWLQPALIRRCVMRSNGVVWGIISKIESHEFIFAF